LCTEDRFFPAGFMRRVVAERLGIVPDEIAAGHCVALSRPAELAGMLAAYAAAHSGPPGTTGKSAPSRSFLSMLAAYCVSWSAWRAGWFC
jgi:hypothetical protein